jgi:hypothetical protein
MIVAMEVMVGQRTSFIPTIDPRLLQKELFSSQSKRLSSLLVRESVYG